MPPNGSPKTVAASSNETLCLTAAIGCRVVSDMPGREQTIRRLRYCCFEECLCGFSGKIFATASGPC
jgi:hypothetical protein